MCFVAHEVLNNIEIGLKKFFGKWKCKIPPYSFSIYSITLAVKVESASTA